MNNAVTFRALRSHQGGVAIYAFFLPGRKLLELADINRLTRQKSKLEGFQRESIQKHIKGMVEYLSQGDVLFPNAVLIALSHRATFVRSRGPIPKGLVGVGEAGILKLPPISNGNKCAWIVDGQQRSTALAKLKSSLPVPVVAFVSSDLKLHREQFILVNKARPLPKRLVDELLPQIDASRLPTDLAMRQIPSAIVDRLNEDTRSPFHQLIRRSTSSKEPSRVVIDSALVRTIQRQIQQPLGALAAFRSVDCLSADPAAMYDTVLRVWSGVKRAFPSAWGLPPERSRLMHSAGIAAVGALIDYLTPRGTQQVDSAMFIEKTLRTIAPDCAWTAGRWPDLDCAWNEIESTTRDIRRLTDQLIRLVNSPTLRRVA